jgi:hypothetical protein
VARHPLVMRHNIARPARNGGDVAAFYGAVTG